MPIHPCRNSEREMYIRHLTKTVRFMAVLYLFG
jgi:hypothetical protein